MPQPGYVYLMRGDRWHKIGRCQNPADRLAGMTRLPFPVSLVCTIPTDNMNALEKQLHQRYAAQRTNGEWFLLTDEQVAEIVAMSAPGSPRKTNAVTKIRKHLHHQLKIIALATGENMSDCLSRILEPLIERDYQQYRKEVAAEVLDATP